MAKTKIKNKKGLLPLILGIFLIFSLYNISDGGGRAGNLLLDENMDDFSLIIEDHQINAEVGQRYWISLYVNNDDDDNPGAMWVQCSILNKQDHIFLIGLQSVTVLSTKQNCVENEPFTQTARVELDAMQHITITYSMLVPDTTDKQNQIYCEAFEQCEKDADGNEQDSFTSSYVTQDIVVVKDDGVDDNGDGQNPNKDACEPGIFSCGLFSGSACYKGFCIDKENIPDNVDKNLLDFPDTSDTAIGGWMSEHKIILILVAFVLVFIGMIVTFKDEPRLRFLQ